MRSIKKVGERLMRNTVSFKVLGWGLILGFSVAAPVQAAYQNKPVKVFIFSGQSNMVGTGTWTSSAPEAMRVQSNVLYDVTRADDSGSISADWEILGDPADNMGPEVVSIARFAEAFPDEQICAIKVSAPGTGLDYWKDSGREGHDTLMARIDVVAARLDAAVTAGDIPSWTFDGFLWMQGENEADAVPGPAAAYEADFTDFVSEIRVKTSEANLPVVLGRISIRLDPSVGGPVNQPQLDQVRAGQVSWATNDAQGAWVDTDDLTLIDEWHFGNTAQVTLGNRFGEAWFNASGTRPRVTIIRAAGQADRSSGTAILYTATFSAAVSGFDSSDVTVFGDTGGSVTVTEVAPSNGTTYEIKVQGMTYPGVVDVAIANAAATAGSLDSLPGFAEFTQVVWASHQGVADLILYDPMTSVARAIDGADHGIGWAGNGWNVQSDRVGYKMESGTPLTYTNLLSSPGYASGGDLYVSSGRQFDLETTFRPWMTDKDAGAVDVQGTTFWLSYLVRPQTASQKYTISLNRGTGWGGGTPTATVERGTDGDWHLIVLGTDIDTGVPVVLNQTDLMVLKLEIGGVSNPSKTHLWVNPDPDGLGGIALSEASATVSDSQISADYTFARLYWMPGDQPGYSALDEIRLGTSFASVTPSDVEITEAPSAPASLVATAASVSEINLSWTDTSSIEAGFYIERGLSAGSLVKIATNSPNVTTFADSGLTHTTEYFYRVTAFNAIGNSTNNPTASETTLVPAPPAAPSALQATGTGETTIDLSWVDHSADETGFVIERKTTGSFAVITTNSANDVSFSDSGLSSGVTYTYQVKAINDVGPSAYTSDSATTLVPSAPDAPTNLQASRASETSINLSWADNSDDETGFVVEWKTTGSFAVLAIVSPNVVSYTDSGLTTSVTYTYRVKATNATGDSAYTTEESATTTPAPSGPATGFIISDENPVVLTFEADLDGVFMATAGSEVSYNVGEPDGNARNPSNADRGNVLFSESVAVSHSWDQGDGAGNNSATRFAEDGNNDGDITDQIGYSETTTILGSGAVGNHAYQLSGKKDGTDDYGENGLYLRVYNNTGETITEWTFGAKIYFGETGANQFSVLDYSYAIDNGTNPNTMSFTSFGTPPLVQQGDVITTLAGTMDETVTTASVADGNYIILKFADITAGLATSQVHVDDISVTAMIPASDLFDDWATDYGLTGVKTNDYDEDGMNDFHEYALGGNPTNAANVGNVGSQVNGVDSFAHIYWKRTDDTSLVYTLVDMTNLMSGVSNTNDQSAATSGPSGTPHFDSVTNQYDTTGKVQQFFNLIVE